ncbi:Signal transduction histidine kinase [Nonomuraea solani]|uniref:histidine kinase n=1 Tax=Nonomuraea solani TaxID=1144553 RepID=A0A1H6EK62_9ACTN|nr:histidine kinase [Nonomuraea solani]SEG98240.1 Signal transduction histidine kinase [Nonomuraea solani]
MDGARPRPIDAVAVLVAAGLTPTIGYPGPGLVILLAGALPVLWMRRAPLTVAWISAGTAIVLSVLSVLVPAVFPPPAAGAPIWPPACAFAAYGAMALTAERHRGLPRWLPVIVLALAVLTLPDRLPLVARTEAVIALAVMYGLYVSVRDRLRDELAERSERVERERLAGEMHDVVTHRVSRMVLQAGVLGAAAGDERARASAEDIRATGCEALDELRHMVALLRRDTGEGFDLGLPLPDLRSLVTESALDGMPVELTVDGTPVPVSGLVGRTAYLVVQEALANVRKHAPGADVRVRVRYTHGFVRLGVRNTAGQPDAWVAASEPGMSLLDLRRRVEVAGGELETGPGDDGGFHVEATFPTAPA